MENGYVSTALGQLHYRSDGTGKPLVLLPPSNSSTRVYLPLIERLSTKFKIIAVDLPGTGESAPLQQGTSFEDVAAAINEVIVALKLGPVNLYGIHAGNKIGAALAACYPETVRRFVFAGQSHSIIPDQETRNIAIRPLVSSILEGDYDPAQEVRNWALNVSADASSLEALTLEKLEFYRNRWVDQLLAMRSRPATYLSNFGYDLGRDLARISADTLVLEIATPNEDQKVGRQGPAVLALLQNGSLRTLEEPGGEGLTMEHRYVEIAEILTDFFASN